MGVAKPKKNRLTKKEKDKPPKEGKAPSKNTTERPRALTHTVIYKAEL